MALMAGIGMIVFGSVSAVVLDKFQSEQLSAIERKASILGLEKPAENANVEFVAELYSIIKESYWDKISDNDLSELFLLATQKITKEYVTIPSHDEAGVRALVERTTAGMSDKNKKTFVTSLGDVVLANLKPAARSRLYTKKQEEALRNTVENVNPEVDLYADLGLTKGASMSEIDKAYSEQAKKLEAMKNSPEVEKKLQDITYARDVLAKPSTKGNYDKGGNQPTVTGKVLKSGIAYIHIKKIAPLTLSEFSNVVDTLAPKSSDTLILDLRGNSGGAVDLLQYFLGPFIGPGQYGYEFFHQGDYDPYKTKTTWLPNVSKYTKVAVIVDHTVQSSAEVMAAALKKYRFGVLVGTKTKGWGTIEQIIPIQHSIDDGQTYSVLIVQSVSLRDDSQPIEGRGVDPNIDITAKGWEQKLTSRFNQPELTDAVKDLWLHPLK